MFIGRHEKTTRFFWGGFLGGGGQQGINLLVFVVARLLWTTGDEVRPYPGLPGHSLKHLQDCQHGHVHLGAWKGPVGQTGQGQCLDGWTQWPVTVATGMMQSELNVLAVVATVEIRWVLAGKWTDSQVLAGSWFSFCWRISSYLPGIVIDGVYMVMHANGFNYVS